MRTAALATLLLSTLLLIFGGRASTAGHLGEVDFPLAVDASGRRLQDAYGRPFLVHGDAAWSLIVQLTKPEVETYLEGRRQRGFNTVLVNLIERGFGGPQNRDGELPFVPANDFTSPNEDYFAHVDWVIDKAAEKNMLVLLTPAYLGFNCGDQGWCDQLLDHSLNEMRNYGRYLGDRYKDKRNILWVHGGDADAGDFSGALSRVNAIAEGIRELAPGRHLHTGHCSRNNSGVDCYQQPWLDVNNTYSDCSDSLAHVRDDYDRSPIRAFFYIEGEYENEGASSGCLIDQHAWAVLGGGSGHVFGNSPVWLFGNDWQDELDSSGSLAMEHLNKLFLSRAWFRLEPDLTGQLLTGGANNGAVAALTTDEESALIYVPTARTITVNLNGLADILVHAWYFNPSNGNLTDLGFEETFDPVQFSVPGRRVLVLDVSDSFLPPPGSEPYPFGLPVPGLSGGLGISLALLLLGSARLCASLRR